MATQPKKTNSAQFKRVADHLQRTRRNKQLSVPKVAKMMRVPDATVRALENPNRSKLPSSNVSGLYRLYGDTIGVDPAKMSALLKKAEHKPPSLRKKRTSVRQRSPIVFSNIGTRIVVAALLLVILGYAAWQAFGLVAAPKLSIDSPMNSTVLVVEPVITVSGSSSLDTSILVNSEPTIVNAETKRFTQDVYLVEGYNRVTVEATNNVAKSTSRVFTVIYQPR